MPNFPVTATDTGLTITEALVRGVTRANLISAAFPSFGTGAVLDNFNRADENPLSQGGNWTNLGGQRLKLVSNAVVSAATVGNLGAMSYSALGDLVDCEAWVTLTGSPSNPTDQTLYSGVFARQRHTGFVIATGQACYQVYSDPAVGEILLVYENVGGGVTQLGSWPITTQPGDQLGIRCIGTTISAWYKPVGGDWQELGSATDTHEPSGYIGLLCTDSSFSMDNFGGGAASPDRPFDSIQPNHYVVNLTESIFLAPFGATSILDDFNRPNENPLSGGGRWTRQGTFGGPLVLSSHTAVPANVGVIDQMSYVAAGDLYDCEAYVTLSTLPWAGNSGDAAGLVLRQDPSLDTGKGCYKLQYTGGASPVLGLTWVDASGGSTGLGQWAGLALANGDSIGLRAIGSQFTVMYRHGAGAWQVAGTVTDSSGTHGYIGLSQDTVSGVPNATDNFGGGHVGLWDAITPIYAPGGLFPVQGLTVTDSLSVRPGRRASDTGLTVTDGMIIFLNGRTLVGLTDNGLVLTDSIQKYHSTGMADTALAVSDSTFGAPIRRRLTVDSLTFTDALAKAVSKHVADTGLTVTDALRRTYPVALTTTGLTVTDALARGNPSRQITDTGLTLSFGFAVQVNGHNAQAQITDTGLAVTPLLAKAAHYFRTVGFGGDTGLHITDGIRRTVSPPPPPGRRIHADFTYAVSGLTVTFTDTSTPGPSGPITAWFWTFGDGATSTAHNPSHTYAGSGTYNVTLTVTGTGPDGLDSVAKFVTTFVPAVGGIHLDFVVV